MQKKEGRACVIVGGGPVGLLAALYAARAGLSVLVLEKNRDVPVGSRAIGIMPPSLEILAELGLVTEFIRAGLPIHRVSVFGTKRRLGGVDFSSVHDEYPFVLSLPQAQTESILRETVSREPNIEFRTGVEVTRADMDESPTVWYRDPEGGRELSVSAPLVLACDGAAGPMRQSFDRDFPGEFYWPSFAMGDFEDRTAFGDEARLFFTRWGAVESFPLPGGARRWIVQTTHFDPNPDPASLAVAVASRTGIDLGGEPDWVSPFRVRRNLIDRYWLRGGDGLVIFLGDAAHLMSPIGGQGMNTGFADVQMLRPILERFATGTPVEDGSLKAWERKRRRAFRVAASRAARGMALGTVRGGTRSLVRNWGLWWMLNGPLRNRVPLDYSMMTIPHRNLSRPDGRGMEVLSKRRELV